MREKLEESIEKAERVYRAALADGNDAKAAYFSGWIDATRQALSLL